MTKTTKQTLKMIHTMKMAKTWFAVTAITAISMFVAGFFIPPTGVIDGSVLTAGGILFAFAALAQLPMLVKRGTDVTVSHGQTSVTVNNPDIETKEEKEE